MKSWLCRVLLLVISILISLPQISFGKAVVLSKGKNQFFFRGAMFLTDGNFILPLFIRSEKEGNFDPIRTRVVKTPTEGGIRETIPRKYQERFAEWKKEFLETDLGKEQWERYTKNKNFILTIKVSAEKNQGARTDEYLWDEKGNFVGATITLGNNLEKGFPEATYYPVMSSLSLRGINHSIDQKILAATKIAHELGHVNQTFNETKEEFVLRHKLGTEYIKIFLSNGHNPRDRHLLDLAERMGGTPVKIWESREYWSEVNALLFLNEKISNENFYCRVFNQINRNIEDLAKNYEDRFERAINSNSIGAICKK